MPISESQLETWSQQGSTGQFTTTYGTIRADLLSANAPYPIADVNVHLQGSYGNDTNVWADSDVDVVLCHSGAYFYDLSHLNKSEQLAYRSDNPSRPTYGYFEFKKDAETYIKGLYPGADASGKAVKIPANSSRRDADVVIRQLFRQYYSYAAGGHRYHEGLAFYTGTVRIENFPKQHSDACTAKHQATNQNFKRVVRIFKNMRNSLINEELLPDKVAPSYFIEGLLFNVPDHLFSGSYQEMWVKCFNWIVTADRSTFTTASGRHWLIRDGYSVCWPPARFDFFMSALKTTWER